MNASRSLCWLVFGTLAFFSLLAPNRTDAQVVRQLTDVKTGSMSYPAIDDTGTDVFVSSSNDPVGTNPSHAFQVLRYAASTGAAAQLTTAPDGTYPGQWSVSVSNDDQWVAFLSRDNPTGQNADRSGEVFVMKRDGTSLQQITNHPGAGTGEPLMLALAGGGTKVVFASTANLTGGNSGGKQQLFVVNKDGTGLSQVTSLTGGTFYFLQMSDDATKIAFVADADPFGTNTDDGLEVFAINADGTGLKQLTTTPAITSGYQAVIWMAFAGGGSKIAFSGYGNPLGTNADGNEEVFVVDYAGTNLKQLTNINSPSQTIASEYPGITDDGTTIYYTGNPINSQNPTGQWNLWRITSLGTSLTRITNTGIEYADLVLSGSGNRIAFRDVKNDKELKVIDTTGANLRTLTSSPKSDIEYVSMDGAGGTIAFASTDDLLPPGNSAHNMSLFTMHAVGTGLAQLTSGISAYWPSIARGGSSIVFWSFGNPLGTNADGNWEIFRIAPNGTGLAQVTNTTDSGAYQKDWPQISGDGNIIDFTSNGDWTGQNADHSYELFKINADGTGLTQLTNSPAASSISEFGRLDFAGLWMVFDSDGNLDGSHPLDEVYRMKTDGTGLQALTTGTAGTYSTYPDISSDGSTICFDSTSDLTGGNPDHNDEIFVWQSGVIRQLTSTTGAGSGDCRISGNGAWVYFASWDPVFEQQNAFEAKQAFRVNVATGVVQRVDGLGFGTPSASVNSVTPYYENFFLTTDDTGTHAAWSFSTNSTRANPDYVDEIVLYDFSKTPAVSISSGPAPTHVSWDVEAGPIRYDVIRGDLANVHLDPTTVNLGTVACVVNDPPVNSTEGSDDGTTPPPGHVFFYVYRGSQGLAAGPGSYGQGTGGKERVASGGDCNP